MDLDTFIVATYCLVEDLMRQTLTGRRLRQRGPQPLLDDREVITMEVVGEFLGMDTDKAIFLFFGRHYEECLPRPGEGAPHHLRPPGGQPLGREEVDVGRPFGRRGACRGALPDGLLRRTGVLVCQGPAPQELRGSGLLRPLPP